LAAYGRDIQTKKFFHPNKKLHAVASGATSATKQSPSKWKILIDRQHLFYGSLLRRQRAAPRNDIMLIASFGKLLYSSGAFPALPIEEENIHASHPLN
jgi:hypothetical protein